MNLIRTGVVAASAAVWSISCDAQSRAGAGAASITDSAGVAIVGHADLADAPVTTIEVLSLGVLDGAPEETFDNITDIEIDVEGRMYVLDRGDQSVRVFGPTGAFVTRFGGPGEGPGEFRAASELVLRRDTVVVYDWRLQKLAVFGRDGSLLSTRPWRFTVFEVGFPQELFAASSDTYVLTTGSGCGVPRRHGVDGVWRMLRVGRDGSVDTLRSERREDIVPVYSKDDRSCTTTRSAPFRPARRVAGRQDGSFVMGDGREYDVQVFAFRGGLPVLLRRIRVDLPAVSTSRADVAAYRATATPSGEDNRWRDRVREVLDSIPVPATWPFFDRLRVDDRDRIWVRRPPRGSATARWDVFAPDGRYAAAVEVPSDLTVFAIHGDEVVGVWRDELDVQYVKRLRTSVALPASR